MPKVTFQRKVDTFSEIIHKMLSTVNKNNSTIQCRDQHVPSVNGSRFDCLECKGFNVSFDMFVSLEFQPTISLTQAKQQPFS